MGRYFDDRVTNGIKCLFPNLVLGQIANTFEIRPIRPKDRDDFELFWRGYSEAMPIEEEGRL